MSRGRGRGIFRERAHSPGRECDDAEILRLTGKSLETQGFEITLMEAEALALPAETPLDFLFVMCERRDALDRLAGWEAHGVPSVNASHAILDTYRDRMIARFAEAGVPFVESRLVSTAAAPDGLAPPVWIKRADVHNTQEGDVMYAATPAAAARALAALGERGIPAAVVQPHVPGDLVKFYGIGSAGPCGGPRWFRWFHHRDQQLAHHPVDAARLARLAGAAAAALGLEVYGGDVIATGTGLVLLDVNAWPSFALYREEAAAGIAAHLAERFTRTPR